MSRKKRGHNSAQEPSQRQLRAGELMRHALVDILSREEFHDADLHGVTVTIGEVRCSPDLRHATIYCSPLADTDPDRIRALAAGLNRAAKFLRGRLGREIDMKFTPALRFVPDLSYDEASAMDQLLRRTGLVQPPQDAAAADPDD
jgi:ribosome-binding factor A